MPQAKEICPGLILGGLRDLEDMLCKDVDVLVPLDRLPGSVWERGFRGEILYCPITDYGILPNDVLEELVRRIVERLRDGKRVAVFCVGGHGRTGYVAACVLFQLGKEHPIAFLRQNYSPYAVETEEQEEAVERFCLRHVAETYWHCKSLVRSVRIRNTSEAKNDLAIQKAVWEIDEALGPEARFLVRWSGAEPVVRVLAETPDEKLCEGAIARFVEALQIRGYLAE